MKLWKPENTREPTGDHFIHARTELGFRESGTGWIPPSPLVQINLYQGEILPYNTELVGQAFGSLVGWIVREDRSSAFQSERGQVHRPTEQILLGNQVHLYRAKGTVMGGQHTHENVHSGSS